MTLPVSIEPYLEPEVEQPRAARWCRRSTWTRAVSVPFMIVTLLLLWDDAARKGPWPGLPGPVALMRDQLALEGAWVLAGAAFFVTLGILIGRSGGARSIPATVPLPRLPVFLRFDGRRALVVGGGAMAAAKIPALLAAGADVTVVAPSISSGIDRSRVRVIERAFQDTDLDGMWFVTTAAPSHVNHAVREAAETRALFVNAVDDAANATAYLGGCIARSGLTVAFSTTGRAPALAGLLREAFDALIPQEIDQWVEQAHELSRRQRASRVPMAERRPQLLETLNRLYADRGAASRPR